MASTYYEGLGAYGLLITVPHGMNNGSFCINRITKKARTDLITPSAAATVRPGLRSAASSSVAVPRTISSLGDRSFAAAGPRAWNKLPPPLRRVYSPDTFKRQLKTFLYNHAFNLHC